MTICERLTAKTEKLAVVGLGYVGLPIAAAFSTVANVIGFDKNAEKIEQYRRGIDVTREVGDEALARCRVDFTSDETKLCEALFIIVAVPTPVDEEHKPDLSLLKEATRTVGRHLRKGAIVVYESTVYPGVTEDICVPILEAESGLQCGEDFKVGYSPERINPGDREHRLETIVKVVAGMDAQALDDVADVYGLVVKAGIHRAPSIKAAEAAKVIENSQRDINIAFMNELAMICHKLDIDTKAVLDAAGTKWNFLPFAPGLVGGHCVGVDPYYLTHLASQIGIDSRIIAMGRTVNDGMGRYVAAQTVKLLTKAGIPLSGARVAILGLTFKENCPDTRNTRVIDIYRELEEYGITCIVSDPIADRQEVRDQYGIESVTYEDIRQADAVIVAVAHDAYKTLTAEQLARVYAPTSRILIDVKGILDCDEYEAAGYIYWRL